MSVWQDYLLGLAYVYPSNEQQSEITDRVFELLKILLHHAIKFEFGGWRVWIDTLAILHGRVNDQGFGEERILIRESLGCKRRLLSKNKSIIRKYQRSR